MNFQFYLEKLFASENFQRFKDDNPDCFPCSCFISINVENKKTEFHFDYYCPKIGKMYSFQSENNMEKIPITLVGDKIPDKISLNYDFEFNEVKDILNNEMKNQNVKGELQKILLSLQNIGGKDFLVGTVFISMMGMLKIKIDIVEKKIIEFEKKSFFDMVNIFKKGEK